MKPHGFLRVTRVLPFFLHQGQVRGIKFHYVHVFLLPRKRLRIRRSSSSEKVSTVSLRLAKHLGTSITLWSACPVAAAGGGGGGNPRSPLPAVTCSGMPSPLARHPPADPLLLLPPRLCTTDGARGSERAGAAGFRSPGARRRPQPRNMPPWPAGSRPWRGSAGASPAPCSSAWPRCC